MFMQTAPEINWWAIVLPSLITGFFVIAAQILIALWLSRNTENYKKELSKEIEDYKKDISKELENHKIQLQSDFQTKFHEFQTRFSLLQQKRAEVFSEISVMILSLLKTISSVIDMETRIDILDQENELLETYILKNRFYIDKESTEILDTIQDEIFNVVKKTHFFMAAKKDTDSSSSDVLAFEKEIDPMINKIVNKADSLDERFLQILFPESLQNTKLIDNN